MARLLDDLRGHATIVARFRSSHKQNRLANTFCLAGPQGVGKKTAAWAFAQELLCERTDKRTDKLTEERACGECPSCGRVARRQSESVLFIAPEGSQIKMEQAQQVRDFLSLRALRQARVVIIDSAHVLNVQAANALLKTFEEPPANTHFFLICPSPSSLLATVRSRVQVLRFGPLSESELAQVVEAPEWVIASSQGRVQLAELLLQPEWSELRQRSLQLLLSQLRLSGPSESQELPQNWQELAPDKASALFVAHTWAQLLRDACIRRSSKQYSLHNPDHQQAIDEIAAQLSLPVFSELTELALSLDALISANLDRALIFENFFFSLHRLKNQGASDQPQQVPAC